MVLQLFPGDGRACRRSPASPSCSTCFLRSWRATSSVWARCSTDRRRRGLGADPGLTDDPVLWEEGCARLAASGVRCVQGVAPALSPSDRRRLAERWGKEKENEEALFAALFHREPPSERDFARAAQRHGLAPFLPRPLPRPPVLRIENRRIGGAAGPDRRALARASAARTSRGRPSFAPRAGSTRPITTSRRWSMTGTWPCCRSIRRAATWWRRWWSPGRRRWCTSFSRNKPGG